MLVETVADYEALSELAAREIAHQIRMKPDSVLGLATGSTPRGIYDLLIKWHKEEGLDFSKVTTFNLDEYVGLPPFHTESYNYFMWENFFKHVNVTPSRVFVPQSLPQEVDAFCEWYEDQIKKAGGIDLQLLGIGANGHLAFNEPGSSLGSRTRIKTLAGKTVRDNARFFEREEVVPRHAITMGIGTIMEARRLILVASGEGKATAIKATIEGPVTAMVPATIVQLHRDAYVIIDEAAASKCDFRHHNGISEPKEQADD